MAVQCAGETDINPIGAMGKVAQLLFAVLAPRDIVTNLMAAAVVRTPPGRRRRNCLIYAGLVL